MLYTKKSFSVPASAGTAAECARVGHTQPDGRGKCYRCAEKVIAEFALEGGPFDGDVLKSSEVTISGTTIVVERDGGPRRAIYMLISERQESPLRFRFDCYAADVGSPAPKLTTERGA